MERVTVFVDGAGVYSALKRKQPEVFDCGDGSKRVQYHDLSMKLVGPTRELVRTYYYDARLKQQHSKEAYQAQQRFLRAIQFIPYLDVKLGRIVKANDGRYKQKGVDVMLAVDMLTYAIRNAYDTAILIAADEDFVPAVERVKTLGKHVELAFPNRKCIQLHDAADSFRELTPEYLSDCLLTPHRRGAAG